MKQSTKMLLQSVSAFLGGTMNGLHSEAQALKKEVDEHLELWGDGFEITCISREDLKGKGYDVSKIDDAQMERLADKMGDDYCEQLFWVQLPIIADYLGLEKTQWGQYDYIDLTVEEAVEAWDNGEEVYAFDTRDDSEFLICDMEDCSQITNIVQFEKRVKELTEQGSDFVLVKHF